MDSSIFKILLVVIVVGFAFHVATNISEGIENRNETYLKELGM